MTLNNINFHYCTPYLSILCCCLKVSGVSTSKINLSGKSLHTVGRRPQFLAMWLSLQISGVSLGCAVGFPQSE